MTAKMIMWLYFFMILICFLDFACSTPLTALLRKVRYLYIIVMALLMFIKPNLEKYKGSKTVLFCLFLHTILFGIVLVNKSLENEIHEHFSLMINFLLVLLVTFDFVRTYHMEIRFCELSYFALSITLLKAFLQHPVIRHPKFWIWSLTGGLRWKESYGFLDANFAGYYCFAAIALSLFLLNYYTQTNKRNWEFLLIVCADLLFGLMVLSTGSRSSILSTFIACTLYLFFTPEFLSRKYAKILRTFMVMLAFLILVWVLVSGVSNVLSFVWENSNRENNVSVNFDVFVDMDAWITGMGYVESNLFSLDVFQGYDTWNIDMYYLYIFFATGIVGASLIALVLLRLSIAILGSQRHPQHYVAISVYVAMLFNAFWQVNLFTYRFYPSLCLTIVLLNCSCETVKPRLKLEAKRRSYE